MVVNLIKIGVLVFLAVLADFLVWRRLKEDYPENDIFNFSLFLIFFAGLGGWLGHVLEYGKLSLGVSWWGMMLFVGLSVTWWSKKYAWDGWEIMDMITVIFSWLWLIANLPGWGEFSWGKLIMALAGLLLVAYVRRNYRNFRWYRLGKVGLVALFFLGWLALTELAVAFMTPGGIYLGGLKPGQIVCAYILAYVLITIYLRSGWKIKEIYGSLKIKRSAKKS